MSLEPGWGFAVNPFFEGKPGETAEMLRLAPDAEAGGFDSVWIGDHVLWHTPIIDGITTLATFAGTTSRVKIGTAIMLLGLRKPGTASKMLTSLNVLSGNRLILGVGVGGENPAEFDFTDTPYEHRGRLLDESLDFLYGLWDQGENSDQPRPEPMGERIPLLVGGRSNASRRRIRKYGAGWISAFVSPDRIRKEGEILNEGSDSAVPIVHHLYIRTGEDQQKTVDAAGDFLGNVYAMPPKRLMDYSVAGTPEFCAEQLAAYVEAGAQHIILRPAAWDQREQLWHWSERLLPLLSEIDFPATVTLGS